MSEKQYRILEEKEKIQAGDEYRSHGSDEWNQVIGSVGFFVADYLCLEFRRPIPTPTPTPPDLEKEREWLTLIKCTCSLRDFDFSKGGWIPNHDSGCALEAKYHLCNELTRLRAENERMKAALQCVLPRMFTAWTQARAALSGSAEKGGG